MKRYLLFILLLAFCAPTINAQCPESNDPGVHIVQKGETLYRIAETHDVTVSRLLRWNKLDYGAPLSVCQKLYVDAFSVPAGGPVAYSGNTNKSNGNSAIKRILNSGNDKEVLREREVPMEYDNTPKERLNTSGSNQSARWNEFGNNQSSDVNRFSKKQSGNRHIVQPGETMAMLAELYGYSEKRFRDLNAMNSVVEATPGSMILSSDCTCDRINYKDDGGLTGFETARENEWEFNDNSVGENTSNFNEKKEDSRPATSTASGSTAMSNVELMMVDEINLMRSNPAGYVRFIEAYVADQKANNGWPIDQSVVNELIQDLRKSPVLSNLQPLSCVYNAAQKHGEDLRRMGAVEHQGSDGLWPWDRVRNACPNLKDGNENLVGGPESVRESVIILLIDEGIPSRGHRVTMMRSDWQYVACYKVGTIGDMPNVWVQQFGY